MEDVRWEWLLLAVLFVAASKVMHGLRWWLLLRRAGRVPLAEAVLLLLAATGVSVLVPLRAGAVLQVQVLNRRHGMPRAVVMGTLVAEALLDALLLLVFAVAAVPLVGLEGGVLRAAVLSAIVAATAAGLILLLGRRHATAAATAATDRVRAGAGALLANVARGLATLGGPASIALLLLPTLGDWLLAATAHWVVGSSFGLEVPAYAYLGVEIVGNLVGAMPLSQANVGPYDLAVQQTLAAFGVDAARATAFAVTTHATIIVAEFGVGLVAAWLLRLRPEDIVVPSDEAHDRVRPA
jgi:uncharacterized membrane protein YbhN (UPF0104 family)